MPNICNIITKIAPGIPPMTHISITQAEYFIPIWKIKLANDKIIIPIMAFIMTCFAECRSRQTAIIAIIRTIGSINTTYYSSF